MSSVDEFCDSLFSKEPESPGSVSLTIDVSDPSEQFEVFLLIMTNGLKKWYGDKINIISVSLAHIQKLKEYFISFSINIHVDQEPKPDIYSVDNSAYLHKSKLEDMRFTVVGPTSLYTIWFSFAIL